MEKRILGLHHITAIAGDAQRNYDFYTKVMGLRMVKKTVNFDDPQTYHFYFGDEMGTPGSILTFFPWPRVKQGKTGTGMVTEIGYSVPVSSLGFWKERFESLGITHGEPTERFGAKILPFRDPDGLDLVLIETETTGQMKPWETKAVTTEVATRGFHSVTLTLSDFRATAAILTEVFDYELLEQEGSRYRYRTKAVENASIVDILELPNVGPGINAGGTNHHVAFRVENEEVLMDFREKFIQRGLKITEKINRDYFYSLYFREPGGVLFELATDNPGFSVDEPVDALGTKLKLPKQYEGIREKIEKGLPDLKQ